MANFWENMGNRIGGWLGKSLAPYINDMLGQGYSVLGNYYNGDQRPQLKGRDGGASPDSIIQNFVGLAVDRSVSRLFRGGVTFNLPDGSKAQQEYIDKIWDLNKKEILLYQLGLHGAVYGTPYVKICPDELKDPFTQELYPRLVPTDPEVIRVKTDPQDMAEVELYVISYTIGETAYWEITVRSDIEYDIDSNNKVQARRKASEENETTESIAWSVDEWRQIGGGARERINQTPWDYDFPPIIHWKNLPSLKSCYGSSDVDDAINIQDKSNFVVSNTGKIIKFHAHPKTVGVGFSAENLKKVDDTPDSMVVIPDPAAQVFNLEMQSDLAASVQFGQNLRQSIFDVAREVDMSSIKDKVGALTNFGLRVLFSDSIDKNDTKRQLYGDAIKEINRRLLVLKNFDGPLSDPGKITWGDPLPVNIKEELEADKVAIDMGIVDKETVTKRYISRYGVDFETIQANLKKQQQKDNENNANIGASILKNFQQGKGVVNANDNRNSNPPA